MTLRPGPTVYVPTNKRHERWVGRGRCKLKPLFKPSVGLVARPRALACGSLHGAKAEAWCLLIHADASLSLTQ